MRSMNLTAVFIPEGYAAFIEALPGANTQGATLDEARANLKEAAALVFQALPTSPHPSKTLRPREYLAAKHADT